MNAIQKSNYYPTNSKFLKCLIFELLKKFTKY